jgi:hypothetical protein
MIDIFINVGSGGTGEKKKNQGRKEKTGRKKLYKYGGAFSSHLSDTSES